jgi:hypothetical protein
MGDVLGNNATPAGIRKLRNALFTSHCPNLEDLRMSCNQAGSAAIEFFELVPLPRKRLNIAHITTTQQQRQNHESVSHNDCLTAILAIIGSGRRYAK